MEQIQNKYCGRMEEKCSNYNINIAGVSIEELWKEINEMLHGTAEEICAIIRIRYWIREINRKLQETKR